MDIALERGGDQRRMIVVRSSHDDCVHQATFHHGDGIVKYLYIRIRFRGPLATLGIDIRDCRKNHVRDLAAGDGFGMAATHVAYANDADFYLIHRFASPSL